MPIPIPNVQKNTGNHKTPEITAMIKLNKILKQLTVR